MSAKCFLMFIIQLYKRKFMIILKGKEYLDVDIMLSKGPAYYYILWKNFISSSIQFLFLIIF